MAGFSIGRNQVFCIPCEFVDYCMKDANPTFIAVYIYGYRQCFSANPKCTVSEVASSLSILESDVIKAWKYWEDRGIVTLTYNNESNPTDFSVHFADLSSIVFNDESLINKKDERPNYKMSDIVLRKSEDKALSQMYEHAHIILDRTLSQNDTMTLYGFYDWLGLPVEVILMIIEHCVSLGKKSMRYIEAVALSWYDMGLCTKEKASAHLSAIEKSGKAKRRFKKLLNISSRDFSDTEYNFLIEWSENMGFSDDMIKLSYEKTVIRTGKPSFQYMHAILKSWFEKGFKTPSDVEGETLNAEKKLPQKQSTPRGSVTRFNSYSQKGSYSDEDIELLISNSSVTLHKD